MHGQIQKLHPDFSYKYALDDLSFEIKEGDRVGLLGHNGSGKTTLLRTLAGIYAPSSGTLESFGDISSLFDFSAGGDEEMTGYENLFTLSLLHYKCFKKAKEKLDEFAEFTGLGEYLNLPMRTYSAGMKVRVGFSVATSVEPDILLIDEVFGAGDKEFNKKSQGRMISLLGKTKILVFSSHSNELIRQFCNKAILLSHGRIIDFDNVDSVIRTYNSAAA